MKVLILGGSGIQGSASASDLLRMQPAAEVVLAGRTVSSLESTAARLNSDRVRVREGDVTDIDSLAELIRSEGCQIVISSVPWTVSIEPLEAAIEAGAHFIDYGLYQNRDFDDRISEFDQKAKRAQVTVIPSCGVAPGLTNMLAAYGASKLDRVDTVHIYVGGIPENPQPPLQYKVVWSLEGVWTQFFEECRVIRGGALTGVEAGSGREELEFPETGRLEAASTDGLGTLLHMYNDPIMKGAREVFEKTIRHPGHYDKIMTLKACGLLDTDPVEVDGVRVSPRKMLTTLLTPRLQLEKDERDMTVMRVRVAGSIRGEDATWVFDMVDYRDMKTGILSMGRTTGYTGSILAPMVHRGRISTPGVVEPEKLGADPELMEEILREYSKRDINIAQRANG
ncbi:MAG: saccharopine dehydrogenase C-terminal domain-containing protein [Bacillota bacterium]